MIKQEIIEKLIDHMIISNEGKHGGRDHERELCGGSVISLPKAAFEKRARELGYINGFRWGVEYPTNGKKPDLPDDVVVQPFISNINWPQNHRKISEIDIALADSFKITDQRYKPVNLDYLYDDKGFPISSGANTKSVSEIPESKSNAENISDWYDYEAQEMKTLPNNNTDVELLMGGVYQCRVEYIGIRSFKVVFYRYDTHEIDHAELPTASFRPLDHNRKAEAEKKRVVDILYSKWNERGDIQEVAEYLYDAGFLRMPAE